MRNSTVQVLRDTETSEIVKPRREPPKKRGVRSSEVVPFSVRNGPHCVLAMRPSRPHAFESVVPDIFTRLASEIGRDIETLCQIERLDVERFHGEATQRQLTETLSAIMMALAATMELQDPYTAGHGKRVAEIACAIAREMGWSEGRIQGLRLAATLHDIGKISVPAEILNKSGPMRESDLMLIKEHAQIGYEILKQIPFTWPIAVIVRQHHERLDGSGYPLGLKGDAILPEARVLAVSDLVDAISSARSYRPALGVDAALALIEKQAGKLLDVEVVRVCEVLLREKRLVPPGFKPSCSSYHAAQSGTPVPLNLSFFQVSQRNIGTLTAAD